MNCAPERRPRQAEAPPFHHEQPATLPFPVEPADDSTPLRAFLLLTNLADTGGPIAARIRSRCRRQLRKHGWRVSRIKKGGRR